MRYNIIEPGVPPIIVCGGRAAGSAKPAEKSFRPADPHKTREQRNGHCMCGIVGYAGHKPAAPILLEGLTKLEYRGYDSSGLAVADGNGIVLYKARGRLDALRRLTDDGRRPAGTTGIGHTRWATHGAPSDVNSHPHISRSGQFAVVHNGIIENYLELKAYLVRHGYAFVSDTDTEVIAHLLEHYYTGDMAETLVRTVNKLRGSYALGVLDRRTPDRFYAARKDSPLVIGLGTGENFIASDMPAVLAHTRRFLLLNDGEIAEISPRSVGVYDLNREPVAKEPFTADWDVAAAEKNGYPHFMLKEIFEQPQALAATVSSYLTADGAPAVPLSAERLAGIGKICIAACGSAYHAGMVGKYFIEKFCRVPVEIDVASEFRYRSPIVDGSTLAVVISQSGETADTLAAVREAKRLGAHTFGIVNVVGSSIARACDDVLYTRAGPEIAVATTKGYTTQVAALLVLGLAIAGARGTADKAATARLADDLRRLPDAVNAVLSQSVGRIQYLASQYFSVGDAYFIGRGVDYALALEGALKLKEISYIHAESYAAGELKHGTISLIEKGSLVVAVACDGQLSAKTLSNVREVRSRGATVIGLCRGADAAAAAECDHVIELPDCGDEVYPIAAVTALQLFAYYVASARGCDIDKPRNLAKSVTVE